MEEKREMGSVFTLEDMQKQLGNKQLFEAARFAVDSLLTEPPSSSSINTLVVHPIHDETFYLTMEHKRRLKKEYGIEAWTFVQKLGDAVLIPAGCPHQVRNLKSCIKVGLDFVSPVSVHECVRLTEEFRVLPQNHSAQQDKLQVKKMILHAIDDAVTNLENHEGYDGYVRRKISSKR